MTRQILYVTCTLCGWTEDVGIYHPPTRTDPGYTETDPPDYCLHCGKNAELEHHVDTDDGPEHPDL